MAFEEIKENTEDLKHQAKLLIDTNIQYYKLLGVKFVAKSASVTAKGIVFLLLGLKILLFLSIALALGIGYWLDNFAYGFLIVSGIYMIVTFIVFKVIDKIVEESVITRISNKIFKD
jgi:hypothetical protein